ncbi:uncharacterized protein LOC143240113 isoform X2 [Tachypleus tridentatus]|uniref:uncharacterized protein LOC143240113 isoform X2 n=1 Tax=Tachypleus tridentatus TaxID=6853 RepID=UPI003FD1D53B
MSSSGSGDGCCESLLKNEINNNEQKLNVRTRSMGCNGSSPGPSKSSNVLVVKPQSAPSGVSFKRLPRITTTPPIQNQRKWTFPCYPRRVVKGTSIQTEIEIPEYQNGTQWYADGREPMLPNPDLIDKSLNISPDCQSAKLENSSKGEHHVSVFSDKRSEAWSSIRNPNLPMVSLGEKNRKQKYSESERKSLKTLKCAQGSTSVLYTETSLTVSEMTSNGTEPESEHSKFRYDSRSNDRHRRSPSSPKKRKPKTKNKKQTTCNLIPLCEKNAKQNLDDNISKRISCLSEEGLGLTDTAHQTKSNAEKPLNDMNDSVFSHCKRDKLADERKSSSVSRESGFVVEDSEGASVDDKLTTASNQNTSDQNMITCVSNPLTNYPDIDENNSLSWSCVESTEDSDTDVSVLDTTSSCSCVSCCSCCSSYEEGENSGGDCLQCLQENSTRALTPDVLVLSHQIKTTEVCLEASHSTNNTDKNESTRILDTSTQEEMAPIEEIRNNSGGFLVPHFNLQSDIMHSAKDIKERSTNVFPDVSALYDQLTQEEFLSTLSIHEAAKTGDLYAVKLLLKTDRKRMDIPTESEINQFDCHSFYLLIRTVDERAWTPIHLAAAHGHCDIVKYLAENGAHLAALDPSGYTAIHIAAMNGHVGCIEVLLVMGCEVDNVTSEGFTPLHLAVLNANIECCQVLLSWGANINRKDGLGRTVHDMAEEYSLDEVAELLSNYEKKLEIYQNILHEVSDKKDPQSPVNAPT